ncbi:preprotein translocase subunit SecA [Patescibacteria group bacterium]|nr:preprotein translocase subunit SecA [Patescibacteria group bacterium]
MSFLSKIFKDANLKRYQRTVAAVNALEPEMLKLSGEDLKSRSLKLKEDIKNGKTLDEALPEAYALIREAARRTLGQRHFDVQLIGGMAIHEGKIVEMLTGEGKTLAATAPVYLNALAGKGVHVVTVNDYLAKRDMTWMGQVYDALGLTVSCLVHEGAFRYDQDFKGEERADKERDELGSFRVAEKFLRPSDRKEAYLADITYGTNHEFGFDYLRDNLALSTRDFVQRPHNFAVIDEVDSILIDEARTPLIIAAPDTQASEFYKTFARVVDRLDEGGDYETDEKLKTVSITDQGIGKVEKTINIENIYAPENLRLVHFLQESLKAKALFKRDRDYIVRNGEIIIVDEFTGRMLVGRRYSGGLHQAIEAKEGVPVQNENRTFAQVTIQNYFRLYKKIAGMTGTAETSAEEFQKVYHLDVVAVPPNKPMVRNDRPDAIYKTKDAKYQAVVEDVKRQREAGRPILVGTTSITNNEVISSYLSKANIPHEVLNAKNHEREGEIIAQAGRAGAVTVATNMAGRGVDIILGGNPPSKEEMEKIKAAGGLHVIGTERHEARRIDNQLRGRSGRQGDPGSTQFYLSLEDDLMRIFGGDRIKNLMQTLNVPEDMPIQSKIVTRSVDQAQTKVEGANFDVRHHLLDFDDVLNKQRSAIYARRTKFMEAGEKGEILPVLKEAVERFGNNLRNSLLAQMDAEPDKRDDIEKQIEEIDKRAKEVPETLDAVRSLILGQHMTRILDTLWVDHLENLDALRESVNIRAYGQHEPLVEYRRDAHGLYQRLQSAFDSLVWDTFVPVVQIDLSKVQPSQNAVSIAPPAANAAHNDAHKDIGRNDPCWCGSGLKYKKCHGK